MAESFQTLTQVITDTIKVFKQPLHFQAHEPIFPKSPVSPGPGTCTPRGKPSSQIPQPKILPPGPAAVFQLEHICVLSRSFVSDSLQPYGLWPARLHCPWDSPGKNTGVGCHALLQGIFHLSLSLKNEA